MEPERFLDPIEFLGLMDREDIRFLLVGRQALVLHGAPVVTADYDFYLDPEGESLDALLALASRLDLELSVPGGASPRDCPYFSLLGANLKLDFFRARVYTTKDGEPFTFAELWQRRVVIPLRDFSVRVPSLEDLILIKRTRLAPRDEEDIKYLQVLIERRDDPR